MSENGQETEEKTVDLAALQKLRDFTREIERIVGDFYDAAIIDNQNLLELRGKLNADLVGAMERHNRELDWMMGKPIEPQTHFAEAVLKFSGGLGG